MKKISLAVIFTMLLSILNFSPLVSADYLFEEDFNGTPVTTLASDGNFLYVARPANGADPIIETAPTGTDRALMSGMVMNKVASAALPVGLSGKLVFETDFRIEVPETTASDARSIRVFDLYGTTNISPSTPVQIFALTAGGFTSTSTYRLSPLHSNSVGVVGPNLNYKQWYTMKLVLDMADASIQVFIDNEFLVEGKCYHANQTVQSVGSLSRVEFSHRNYTPLNYFLVDNLRVYDYTEPAGISSTEYNVGTNTITNIPEDTTVSNFLSNITLTGGASSKLLYERNGVTLKSSGTVATGDILKINDGELNYTLYLENEMLNETFDGIIAPIVTVPSSWKKVERPSDLSAISFDTAAEIGDSSGLNRALLSKTEGDTERMNINFMTPVSGAMEIKFDFRIEEAQPSAGMGIIKLLEINGLDGATNRDNLAGITTGGLSESGFYLRPVYYTASLGNMGPLLPYKTWHSITIIIDTDTDTSSVYLGDTAILLNQGFYSGVTVDSIRQLRSFNNNAGVTTNFMIDNISVKKTEAPPVPISAVYEIDHASRIISNIPVGTPVSTFFDNVTYTKAATSVVYNKNNIQKTDGTIEAGDTLEINPGGLIYSLNPQGIITYNNFDNGIIPPSGWGGMNDSVFSIVPRPEGGANDPNLTNIPDANNKAVYVNEDGSQTYKATYALNAQGDIEFTMDFLIKEYVSNSSVNQIKLCEIAGVDSEGVLRTAVNVNVTNLLRLTYSNGTTWASAVTASGSPFGAWHSIKVVASTITDKVSVWYNGVLFADNYNFMGISGTDATPVKVDRFTELRVYHGATSAAITTAGVKPSSFYYDNIMLRSISNDTSTSSAQYLVGENTISGILQGTDAETVKSRLIFAYGATAEIYSVYDEETPANSVVRNGAVNDGDKLVVTAENNHTKKIYTIKTMPNVEVTITNTLGVAIESLDEITNGKINAKAEVINNGFNNNDTDFVLILVAFSGKKMVSAEYKTFNVPVSEDKVTETLTDFTLPDVENLSVSAFVWDGLSNMIPLSLPYSVQ